MKNQETFFINIFPTNDRRENIDYLKLLNTITEDSFRMGIKYTLFTVGDKRIDPWTLAQESFHQKHQSSPLIAVNPLYVHPLELAKRVVAFQKLYGRGIALNLVTGSFFNEMKAVGDELSFEKRCARLRDFYQILLPLLKGKSVSLDSPFYKTQGAEIFPKATEEDIKFFVSGAMIQDFQNDPHAHFVRNIKPLKEIKKAECPNSGLALGICARKTKEEAVEAVKKLYPEDRKGEMLFKFSLANKETPWNEWLEENLSKYEGNFSYYLNPMKNFWSSAPFIVDSYEEVAKALKAYRDLDYSFFILDYLPSEANDVEEVLKIYRKS